METKEKEPITQVFHPNTVFQLSMREIALIENALMPFEWVSAVIKKSKDVAANNGALLNVYEEDCQKDENGKFKVDMNGNVLIKPEFFENLNKKTIEIVKK